MACFYVGYEKAAVSYHIDIKQSAYTAQVCSGDNLCNLSLSFHLKISAGAQTIFTEVSVILLSTFRRMPIYVGGDRSSTPFLSSFTCRYKRYATACLLLKTVSINLTVEPVTSDS